jgi:hypothetical protein
MINKFNIWLTKTNIVASIAFKRWDYFRLIVFPAITIILLIHLIFSSDSYLAYPEFIPKWISNHPKRFDLLLTMISGIILTIVMLAIDARKEIKDNRFLSNNLIADFNTQLKDFEKHLFPISAVLQLIKDPKYSAYMTKDDIIIVHDWYSEIYSCYKSIQIERIISNLRVHNCSRKTIEAFSFVLTDFIKYEPSFEDLNKKLKNIVSDYSKCTQLFISNSVDISNDFKNIFS